MSIVGASWYLPWPNCSRTMKLTRIRWLRLWVGTKPTCVTGHNTHCLILTGEVSLAAMFYLYLSQAFVIYVQLYYILQPQKLCIIYIASSAPTACLRQEVYVLVCIRTILVWSFIFNLLCNRYTRNLVDQGNGKFNFIILCWGEDHGR